jgi:hypothetical protein
MSDSVRRDNLSLLGLSDLIKYQNIYFYNIKFLQVHELHLID